jgi:hypothetical protein
MLSKYEVLCDRKSLLRLAGNEMKLCWININRFTVIKRTLIQVCLSRQYFDMRLLCAIAIVCCTSTDFYYIEYIKYPEWPYIYGGV